MLTSDSTFSLIVYEFYYKINKTKVVYVVQVFALCGLVGVIVPRSGTLVDMVANV